MENVTQWFTTVKESPIHIGNYDYIYRDCSERFKNCEEGYIFNAYWDGLKFTIEDSEEPQNSGDSVQTRDADQWRGIAK